MCLANSLTAYWMSRLSEERYLGSALNLGTYTIGYKYLSSCVSTIITKVISAKLLISSSSREGNL